MTRPDPGEVTMVAVLLFLAGCGGFMFHHDTTRPSPAEIRQACWDRGGVSIDNSAGKPIECQVPAS